MNNRELVLYYGIDKTAEAEWLRLLDGLGMDWLKVETDDLSMTIGSLCGRTAATAPDTQTAQLSAPTESIIVMDGLSEARINALLAAIRQTAGLQITLKAVVTPANRQWTFRALAVELRQEHAIMQDYTKLRSQFSDAASLLKQPPADQAQSARAELDSLTQRASKVLAAFQGQGDIDADELHACTYDLGEALSRFQK